jgi:hypothetical protein
LVLKAGYETLVYKTIRMKNYISKRIIVVTTIILFVVMATSFSSRSVPAVSVDNPSNGCALTAADFNSWFNSGSVTLNGIVEPFHGSSFPNPAKAGHPVPDCKFFRLSEQTFLWLTSPSSNARSVNGVIAERIFESPAFYDVSPPDADGKRSFIPHEPGKIRVFSIRDAQTGPNKLPVTFEKKTGRLVEIEKAPVSAKGLPMILNTSNAETEVASITLDNAMRPVFKDNRGKVIQKPRPLIRKKADAKSIVQQFAIGSKLIYLDADGNNIEVEMGQADGGDVLMSQNNSLVYYSISVNQQYAYFHSYLTNEINESYTNDTRKSFPFFLTTIFKEYAESHGKTILYPHGGAVEIKCSWVEAASLPDASKYIKMKAIIPTYDKTNSSQWIPNGQKTVELAMVGMHIVGSVEWLPDLFWATFEHINNTPNATYSYSNPGIAAANPTGPLFTVPQNTSGQWTFCADGAAGPFNVARMHAEGNKIVANPGSTIGPSNIIRWKPWGTGGGDAGMNNDLKTLNNSVMNMLMDGDVRKNYIQIGTAWKEKINGSSFQEKGSSRLANSTMETFMQGTNNSITTGTTCFSCHGPNGDDKKAYSHIYYSLKPLFNN